MAITDDDLGFLICQRLLASTPVSSLVSTRVRPDVLDPNETMPAIRYEMINSNSWTSLASSGKEASTRIQVDCYGSTRLQANELAAAVKSNLDGYQGTLGNIRIYDCVMTNRYDFRDPPPAGSKHWRKRRTLDFLISHTEPTPSLT